MRPTRFWEGLQRWLAKRQRSCSPLLKTRAAKVFTSWLLMPNPTRPLWDASLLQQATSSIERTMLAPFALCSQQPTRLQTPKLYLKCPKLGLRRHHIHAKPPTGILVSLGHFPHQCFNLRRVFGHTTFSPHLRQRSCRLQSFIKSPYVVPWSAAQALQMEMVSLVLSLSLLLFITYKPYEAAWLNQAVEVACSAASVSSESSQVPFWNDTELRLLLAAMALQRQTF